MGYNLPINGVYRGYNPLTNNLLTSLDIQVVVYLSTCRDDACVFVGAMEILSVSICS